MSRLLIICLLFVLSVDVFAQRRRGPRVNREAALAEAFKGIFFNGQDAKNLFPIVQTGVSTEPVRKAAADFLGSLNAEQRKATVFPVDDLEWRKWDNRHSYERQGMGFEAMTQVQRDRAFGLLRASLSARGLKQSQDIMKLNGTLEELVERPGYGEWLYWITVMGEPSADKPWGWQLDGHHLVINYFVLGDQVVMSPVFMGSEPVTAKGGSRIRRNHREASPGELAPGRRGRIRSPEAQRFGAIAIVHRPEEDGARQPRPEVIRSLHDRAQIVSSGPAPHG